MILIHPIKQVTFILILTGIEHQDLVKYSVPKKTPEYNYPSDVLMCVSDSYTPSDILQFVCARCAVEVRVSPIQGLGLFATKDIEPG